MRKCIQCGKMFDPTHKARSICSSECKRERNRAKVALWHAEHREEENARKRKMYSKIKEKTRSGKKKTMNLDESIAECRALGYGADYGRYQADKLLGRIGGTA